MTSKALKDAVVSARMAEIAPRTWTRMAAIADFFGLKTNDQKKEYMKLTEADRTELASLLVKEGYTIIP